MPKAAAPIFPLRDAWLPALPLLPLVLSAAAFSWLLVPAKQLVFLEPEKLLFIAQPQRNYVHLGDMLSYLALCGFHMLLCGAVIAALVLCHSRLPRRQAQAGLVYLTAILLLGSAVIFFFHKQADNQVLIQLGYKAVCQVIAAAKLPTDLVNGGECFAGDKITGLTALAWVPAFIGMAAVGFGGAFAYATARDLPTMGEKGEPAWREALDGHIKALQRTVYLLSAVLVSSTITITLFAHLPVGLLADSPDPAPAAALSKYANGLSTFWGALFSITLVATFASPALRLLNVAYGAVERAEGTSDLRTWLQEHVFQSLRRQLATVFSLLAPLLVGPLSSLLSSVSGL